MTPTQLRRKLEARLGRPLNVSDARLAELIAEARARKTGAVAPVSGDEWPPPRREPDRSPVPLRRGESDARWSNEALDYPADRSAAEMNAMARHPSAGTPPEFDRPDLHLVASEDGAPTYAQHVEEPAETA
jgi:hypothetical protein